MPMSEIITLNRDCDAIEIPSGIPQKLPSGSQIRIMQTLGTSFTITSDRGYLYRIDVQNADAMGLPNTPTAAPDAITEPLSEKMVWDQLRTIYDPEIPVNIADLGLIYECKIDPVENGNKIDIKMSMTAPGCGMGNVLKADVENKLGRLPDVKQVNVELVFQPPWGPARMSEAARLQLGLDI